VRVLRDQEQWSALVTGLTLAKDEALTQDQEVDQDQDQEEELTTTLVKVLAATPKKQ